MANFPENTDPAFPHPAIAEFIAYIKGGSKLRSLPWRPYGNDLTDFFHFLQFEKYEKRDKRGNKVIREGGYGLGTVEIKIHSTRLCAQLGGHAEK